MTEREIRSITSAIGGWTIQVSNKPGTFEVIVWALGEGEKLHAFVHDRASGKPVFVHAGEIASVTRG
jgi:hypothetical protein